MSHRPTTAEFDLAHALPQIGELIAGKYRVDSILGTGGMGKVFGATHLELGQPVAIKVLSVHDDDTRRDEAHERFLREGRATAALVSDYVVRVYDVGRLDNGAPFMVMEQLRGTDLAQTVQRAGPLAIELAAECVRQSAEAISCAHAQGIVHRDLKPSNLFLTQRSDGTPLVKVLDFGISKMTHAELDPLSGNLTATRSVLGTPFYMSPEQVRDAKKVDFRTDIWSLGLILHELLSGSPAFEGTTLPGVCAAIAADPPAALRLKRPEVPVPLESIVLKCLEKDPTRRFQSARGLADALAPWAGRGHAGPVSDATIRSSPSFMSVDPLREGRTLSQSELESQLEPAGTMASAVLTQSGERVISKDEARLVKREAAPSSEPNHSRLLLGAALLVALGLLVWNLRSGQVPTQSTKPPTAPPAPAAVARTFAVQLESNPGGARVYEGEQLLGSTPMQLSVASSSLERGPRTLVLRKAGFLPYTIVQGSSARDVHLLAELAPQEALAPAASAKPKKPAAYAPPRESATPQSDIFMHR